LSEVSEERVLEETDEEIDKEPNKENDRESKFANVVVIDNGCN
jgi:hypothetical protein